MTCVRVSGIELSKWSFLVPIPMDQQSSARMVFRSSRPERLNYSCRRPYIPATVLVQWPSQATCNDFTMKTLQVLFNLRVSGTVLRQKRSRWNCMCHDAGVLPYTLASWHGFRRMAPISVTTHKFSMKVLRRGRSQQLLWERSTIAHFIVNSSLPTVIARNTFIVIARLHRSRGNLIHYGLEIATSLSLLAMTETCCLPRRYRPFRLPQSASLQKSTWLFAIHSRPRNDRELTSVLFSQWQKAGWGSSYNARNRSDFQKKSIFLKNPLRKITVWIHPDNDFSIYPFTIFLRG